MPSIHIKSAHYPHIRDLFSGSDDNQLDPKSDDEETASGAGNSSSVLTMRPISMPNLKASSRDGTEAPQAMPPFPLNHPDSAGTTHRRRPRSNTASSRIRSHVLERSTRDSRSFRDSTIHHGPSSSTEALNPSPTHPTNARVDGTQASILVESPTGLGPGHGILHDALDEFDSPVSPSSTRRRTYARNHHDDIVEHLDVIDPQVGTVSKLTNAANSIVIPPTGLYSRRPVIVLSSPRRQGDKEKPDYDDPLDSHVDDVLKSPSRIRRTLLGVWSFLKTPMGILTGIYGFLVVFWGAAIVLFLAKIINLHDDELQGFWVEVSSQVVCGLFTVTSVGFIPSRILSTFRIYKIWYYKKETIKRRKEAGLPQLFDLDDLPDPHYDPNFVHVLTDEEHKDLHRQQVKFAYHQTWYRAHGTETHRAFPITMALWICFLNDANSIFQIILCGTMWGMNRFQRPAWSTGILIPAGFLCGIGAAVLIWRGGERTKRVEEVRERLRAVLAHESSRIATPPSPETPILHQPDSQRPTMVKFSDRVPLDTLSEERLSPRVDEEMVVPRTVS